MPPKKTAKTSEAKKATEAKTKKTTKATKAAAKTKTTTKTKKATTKKKVVQEEPVLSNEEEVSPETEVAVTEPVENVQEVEDVVEEAEENEEEEQPPEEYKEEELPQDPVDDEKINAHRIFITRIAFEATKDDLEDYFKKFGTVYDAYCPKQGPYSNLNKGFGFISFENEESIKKVFETSPHIIMGREVIVDRATGTKYHSTGSSNSGNRRPFIPHRRFRETYQDNQRFKRHHEGYPDYQNKFPRRERPFERDPYSQNLPPYRQNINQPSTFDPNKPVSYVFSGSRTESRNHDAFMRTYSNSSRSTRDRNAPKLFVGRIGFDTNVQSLRTYFSQFGEVIDVYIPKDVQTQKGKGFGFLTFANKSSIHTVLDPTLKHVLDGREIIVDYADVHTRRV